MLACFFGTNESILGTLAQFTTSVKMTVKAQEEVEDNVKLLESDNDEQDYLMEEMSGVI